METQYSLRLVKNVFLEIDHRYTPINTDNTDASFMGGWVVIGLLSISHDLLAPLLIHIRRKLYLVQAIAVIVYGVDTCKRINSKTPCSVQNRIFSKA
ncbi:MAG: hypothetical protein KatS3mg066_2399 [Fischerella sp.]|nr:MAG: hypothetical protein KatS3mg066_2399 [Fischerella sp.]